MATLAQIQADVQANTQAVTAATALLQQLAANQLNQPAIDAIDAALQANTAALNAAVTANTPPAP